MPNETPGLTAGSPADSGIAPFLSVVRGNPTDAELAAVVTVLAARAGAAASAAAAAADKPTPARALRSHWSDKSRLMRTSLSPGPDAWRGSALPR